MNQNTDEKHIMELEHEWARALKIADLETLGRILSDDFMFASSRSTGQFTGKPVYLELCENLLRVNSYSFELTNVRRFGDAAVVNALFWQTARYDGEDWSGLFQLTDVWVKREGNWKAASRHISQTVD